MRTTVLRAAVAAAVLVLLPTRSGSQAVGDEQRCKELGANCVCSEPFNTNTLQRVEPSWFNPVDSVVKQCSTSIAGGAIERNINDVTGSNNAAALGALPAGHRVSYFARGAEGHGGIFYGGGSLGAQFVKRGAARWYLYHSPTFQFKDEGACENSKMAAFNSGSVLDKSFGFVHMYNFVTWSPAEDCCLYGPGPNNVEKADWRGKWWRIEVVFTNRAGGNPGFVAKVYMKNVTDNGPELLVVDTSMPGTELSSSSTRTPPNRMDRIWMNNYRQGTCGGWMGFSHYVMAGWDTDAGQRIGPAVEIEGGGGDMTPPATPRNLRIK